jgi:hypothetical protein
MLNTLFIASVLHVVASTIVVLLVAGESLFHCGRKARAQLPDLTI